MEGSSRALSIGNDFRADAYLQLQWITRYVAGLATLDCFVEAALGVWLYLAVSVAQDEEV